MKGGVGRLVGKVNDSGNGGAGLESGASTLKACGVDSAISNKCALGWLCFILNFGCNHNSNLGRHYLLPETVYPNENLGSKIREY